MAPKWWEVVVVTHDVSDHCETFDDDNDVLVYVQNVVSDLRDDLDCAKWAVYVQPHWCGKEDECECSPMPKPIASYKGLTIP